MVCLDLEGEWREDAQVRLHPSLHLPDLFFVSGRIGEGGDHVNVTFRNSGGTFLTVRAGVAIVIVTQGPSGGEVPPAGSEELLAGSKDTSAESPSTAMQAMPSKNVGDAVNSSTTVEEETKRTAQDQELNLMAEAGVSEAEKISGDRKVEEKANKQEPVMAMETEDEESPVSSSDTVKKASAEKELCETSNFIESKASSATEGANKANDPKLPPFRNETEPNSPVQTREIDQEQTSCEETGELDKKADQAGVEMCKETNPESKATKLNDHSELEKTQDVEINKNVINSKPQGIEAKISIMRFVNETEKEPEAMEEETVERSGNNSKVNKEDISTKTTDAMMKVCMKDNNEIGLSMNIEEHVGKNTVIEQTHAIKDKSTNDIVDFGSKQESSAGSFKEAESNGEDSTGNQGQISENKVSVQGTDATPEKILRKESDTSSRPTLKLASFSSMAVGPTAGDDSVVEPAARLDNCSACQAKITNLSRATFWETMIFCNEVSVDILRSV